MNRLKSLIFVWICFILFPTTAFPTSFDSGLWLNPKFKFHATEKLSFGLAFELRWFQDFQEFNQILGHGSFGYKVNSSLSFAAGLSYMGTYREEVLDELRPWQNLSFVWGDHWRFKVRAQLEQRIYPGFDRPFSFRFRKLIGLSAPLNQRKNLFFEASEEFFVSTHNTDWGSEAPFDQNRIKIGVRYNYSKNLSLGLSYMNQHIFRKNAPDNSVHLIVIDGLFSKK